MMDGYEWNVCSNFDMKSKNIISMQFLIKFNSCISKNNFPFKYAISHYITEVHFHSIIVHVGIEFR